MIGPAPLPAWLRQFAAMGGDLVGELRAHLKLWRCAHVGYAPEVQGRVYIRGSGRVVIGDRVRLLAGSAPIELHVEDGAEIHIGDNVEIAGGTSIEASRSVTIVDGARIGAFCKVMDTHFHRVRGDRHLRPEARPVCVGRGACLGPHVIVLPGVDIENFAQVPSGSVVRRRPRDRGPGPSAVRPGVDIRSAAGPGAHRPA